jgi:hypothetical protein
MPFRPSLELPSELYRPSVAHLIASIRSGLGGVGVESGPGAGF